MLKVGITGGIGSGKTQVCRLFCLLGIPVYPADERAKYLVATEPQLIKDLTGIFGNRAYTGNRYNREYIAGLVFKNKTLLNQLNQLIHPYVERDFNNWLLTMHSVPYVLNEAAILFESGLSSDMDRTIVVEAPMDLRIQRIMSRDGKSREVIMNIMENQWPVDKTRSLADWIIRNDEKNLILPQVLDIHRQLLYL
jgi:dephospho-CoA kinase